MCLFLKIMFHVLFFSPARKIRKDFQRPLSSSRPPFLLIYDRSIVLTIVLRALFRRSVKTFIRSFISKFFEKWVKQRTKSSIQGSSIWTNICILVLCYILCSSSQKRAVSRYKGPEKLCTIFLDPTSLNNNRI